MEHKRDNKGLGEHIRQMREERGLSQQELAERAMVTRPYISNLERGQSSPTVDLIVRFAKAMDCKPSDLLSSYEPGTTEAHAEPGYGTYPELNELLHDEEARILYNISPDEIEVLKSVRFLRQDFQPSKKFFLDVLLDLRRRRNRTH